MKAMDRKDWKLDWTIDRLHELFYAEFKKGCGPGCPNNMPNRRGTYCIPALCFVDWLAQKGHIKFVTENLHEIVEDNNPPKEDSE